MEFKIYNFFKLNSHTVEPYWKEGTPKGVLFLFLELYT